MTRRTLWLLDYKYAHVSVLVPFCATDEEDARAKALLWAKSKGIIHPFELDLRHYPRGFMLQFEMISGVDPSEGEE